MADVIWQTEEYRDLIRRKTAATDAYTPRVGVVDIHGDATATSLIMRSNGTTTAYVFGAQPLDAVYDMVYSTAFAVRYVTTIGATEYTLDGTSIKRMSYDSSSVSGSNFGFGDFVGKSAEMTFYDPEGDYDDVSFEGASGVLSYGVKRTNDEYYWVSMGTFKISESQRVKNTVWLSMLDLKTEFDNVHTGSISASRTLFQLAQLACTSAGMTLGTVVGDMPNGTTVVTNSDTLMTISPITTDVMLVRYIAQATGTFAVIGRDDKLYFKWYKEVSPIYSISQDLVNVGQSSADYAITTTGLSWTATDGTKYTNGTATYQIKVTNNPLAFASYATLLTGIAANVVGFSYAPVEFKWFGDPALDVGDIIIVPDKRGNIYSVPITHIRNSNTLSQTIKAVGESKLNNATVTVSNSVSDSIDDVKTVAKFGAITAERVNTGTLDADRIGAASITGTKIAENTIESGNIKANTIESGNIKAGTITGEKIAADTIESGNIKAGTITAASGVIGSVSADVISTGTLSADRIASQSITADKLNVTDLIAMTLTNEATDPDCWATIGNSELDGTDGIFLFSKLFSSSIPAIKILVGRNTGGIHITDKTGQTRIYADSETTHLIDAAGKDRFYANAVLTGLYDAAGQGRFYADGTTTRMYSPNGLNFIYINNTEAYKSIGGVVTIL
jgi:hypothetical protein